MAIITANTKKCGQITINTKPHSYPLISLEVSVIAVELNISDVTSRRSYFGTSCVQFLRCVRLCEGLLSLLRSYILSFLTYPGVQEDNW